MSIRIEVDSTNSNIKMQFLKNFIPQATREWVSKGGDVVFGLFRVFMPVKSGRMLASSTLSFRNDLTAEIRTNSGYGQFVDQGSDTHVIRAKRGKALRFQVGSQVIFRRQIYHPGSRGAHFVDATIDAARSPLESLGRQIFSRIKQGA